MPKEQRGDGTTPRRTSEEARRAIKDNEEMRDLLRQLIELMKKLKAD